MQQSASDGSLDHISQAKMLKLSCYITSTSGRAEQREMVVSMQCSTELIKQPLVRAQLQDGITSCWSLFKLILIFEDMMNIPCLKSNNKGFKSRWLKKPKLFFFITFLSAKWNETLMWPKYKYVHFLPKISAVQVF